jgi:4-carboxymuconolactone decarboxylase
MGDAYVDKALSGGGSEFSKTAQEYVTRSAWDGIWGREGLTFKQRSLVVIR